MDETRAAAERESGPRSAGGAQRDKSLLVFSIGILVLTLGSFRDHRAHRVLGFASIGLAVIMVSTGILVTFGFYEEFGRRTTFVADLGIFVNFIPLYGAAVWTALKRRFDAHRRLMLVASICMMGPALARRLDVVSVSRAATLIFPLPSS